MIKIDDPGEPLTHGEVAALEAKLQTRLPEAYRRFLLAHNGGLPTPDIVDIADYPDGFTDVQVFFGIGRAVESSGLEWNLEVFAGRIPEGCLPIACDSGGSLFCLAIRGADAGKVIFWDIEGGQSPYLVASDFDAFLRKLRLFESDA